MVKRLYLYPFSRLNVTAFALQHDKAVALAERTEDVGTLMAGGGNGQLAVFIAGQQTALEVEATR